MICEANEIEPRLTKPNHPWSEKDQVSPVDGHPDQRAGRTEEPHHQDAPTKRYHYNSHKQLQRHLELLLDASTHARKLKTLKGLTPAQLI